MRITDFPMIDEVKAEYRKLRENGLGRDDAVKELQLSYHSELTIGNQDDGLLFWIGLADAQYALKELSEEVAQQGLYAIRKLEQYFCGITSGDIARRIQRYSGKPMPERKNIRKPKRFRCEWNIGDTFAYQLSGPMVEEFNLTGKFAILRKVDDIEFGDGRLLPIVTVSIWDSEPLPHNSVTFSKASMLALGYGRFQTPKNLYEYRAMVLFKNKKQIASLNLEYLGNFSDISMPENEIFFKEPARNMMLCPEYIDRDCCDFWKMHNYLAELQCRR